MAMRIPECRRPEKVLDWEIDSILNLGIEAKTDVKLGRGFTMKSLLEEGDDAVFLGIGAWQDDALEVEGEDLNGCYTGIDFLSRIGLGEKVRIGRKCAVIGGGRGAAQVRPLRVVQQHEIERVGGTESIPVDVRIISATHQNLPEMVSKGTFREDLWFRLNVFPIMIPPLRQRVEDIPALVNHFIEKNPGN